MLGLGGEKVFFKVWSLKNLAKKKFLLSDPPRLTIITGPLCPSQLKPWPPGMGGELTGEWLWINTVLIHHFPRGTG